jgi:hypothetical protein
MERTVVRNSTRKTQLLVSVKKTYLWGFYPSGKYWEGATHKTGGQIHIGGNFESAEQHAYLILLNSYSWKNTSPLLAVSSGVQGDQAFIWFCKDLALSFLFPRLTSHKHTRMHNNSIVGNHPLDEIWRQRDLEFWKFMAKTWAASFSSVF